MQDIKNQAINCALQENWEQAIIVNERIIAEDPKDIAALNRLARAYLEKGELANAQKTYQQVLKLDKYNPIATKNLRLLPHSSNNNADLISEDFIETKGITKTIQLIKVTSKENLGQLKTKQKLELVPKGRLIAVCADKLAVGYLPDDLSFKITRLLIKGYLYSCCIKSTSENSASVFLREIKRPKRSGYTPTFDKNLTHSKLKKN